MVGATRTAARALQPVEVDVFQGMSQVGINRRGQSKQGRSGMVPDPNGPFDEKVWAMRLTPTNVGPPAAVHSGGEPCVEWRAKITQWLSPLSLITWGYFPGAGGNSCLFSLIASFVAWAPPSQKAKVSAARKMRIRIRNHHGMPERWCFPRRDRFE
jgi:hypothetical protein